MDIEQYKKNVESRMRASKLKKSIKDEIGEYEDQQLVGYELSKTNYKPIIESSVEVKKAIDKKQDELINQIEQNQLALTNTSTNMKAQSLQELEDASEKKVVKIDVNFDDKLSNADLNFINKSQLTFPSALFQEGIKQKIRVIYFFMNIWCIYRNSVID